MTDAQAVVPNHTKVTLLKGGSSNEREVSLESGKACAQALRDEGFMVIEVDTGEDDAIQQILDSKPDVVFIALHGKDGEDGNVQGLCELMRVPYTGSGVLASALAMDKVRSKVSYRAAELPTANWVRLRRGEEPDLDAIACEVGMPCVVKPVCEGSALGVHIAQDSAQLLHAIEQEMQHTDEAIVESFISGTEVTVAVFGAEDPRALPVIEIVPQGDSTFYDYKAKYDDGGARHIIPARLDDEATQRCQRYALEAHRALGCFSVSRTDFIVDEAGECWLLETNTIPGMTSTSLLPHTAASVGIGFATLCRMMVQDAFKR